jgi:hypothetical protein
MAIEKSLSPAPIGIEEEAEAAEALEIEIVNPDMVTLDDGSVEVTIIPGGDTKKGGFNANIAEEMDEDELSKLADDIVDMVETDLSSRKEWADAYVKGLDVLGFKYEERTEPWEGACGVYSTVLAEAAIRFQAETMNETFYVCVLKIMMNTV